MVRRRRKSAESKRQVLFFGAKPYVVSQTKGPPFPGVNRKKAGHCYLTSIGNKTRSEAIR